MFCIGNNKFLMKDDDFMYSDDTIAAISTAPGEGGIGIVRISGDKALEILGKIFVSYKNKKIEDFKTYTLRYGHIINPDTKSVVDEVLVSYMKSPHTYTREDVVEINCHGGNVMVKRILEIVIASGARLAQPGEFTKRAFLNGRIDLSQAEAVIDIIRAKTKESSNIAVGQLEGSLSKKLGIIRDELLGMMSHIEASIDFPEEGVDDVSYTELEESCTKIISEIEEMIRSSETGKILREGLNTVIVGKPNVGKSSLLNALLEENRAIVTDVPGTTRDIIEEYLNIKGIPVNIIDTAGIRETDDKVERIGVERTKKYYDSADLAILMLDFSQPFTHEDEMIFELSKSKKSIILVNKIDLTQRIDMEKVKKYAGSNEIIDVSIKNGIGLDKLKDKIYELVYRGEVSGKSEVMVTNIRHKDLLKKAKASLVSAVDGIKSKLPLDIVSIDIGDCLEHIGEITGETVREDVIDRIFREFCIGK